MTWWTTTAGGQVWQPTCDELLLLPRYKADAFRLFRAGRGDLLMRLLT